MLKQTVTYTDPFTDEQVTETHYFHLSKADIVKMQAEHGGNFQQHLQRIIDAEDSKAIMQEFENVIRLSFGEKTPEGKFIKDPQKTNAFMQSEAYSEFFMTLVTDAERSAQFIEGIMPKGLAEDLAAMGQPEVTAAKQRPLGDPKPGSDLTGVPDAESKTENVFDSGNPRILTQAEVLEMDSDELKSGLATGRYKLQ